MSPQLAEARCAALANENSQLREALRRLGPSKAADDGEAVAVVPAVETSPGVAQAQPRLEVHEAHVEVHALAHQGAALLCEEEEFGSAPDASSELKEVLRFESVSKGDATATGNETRLGATALRVGMCT